MGRLKITQEDDSIRTVAYLDEVQDLANDVDANINKIENLTDDLATHKSDYMPHRFQDIKNDKVYRIGLQLSIEGKPQIIYKEEI